MSTPRCLDKIINTVAIKQIKNYLCKLNFSIMKFLFYLSKKFKIMNIHFNLPSSKEEIKYTGIMDFCQREQLWLCR